MEEVPSAQNAANSVFGWAISHNQRRLAFAHLKEGDSWRHCNETHIRVLEDIVCRYLVRLRCSASMRHSPTVDPNVIEECAVDIQFVAPKKWWPYSALTRRPCVSSQVSRYLSGGDIEPKYMREDAIDERVHLKRTNKHPSKQACFAIDQQCRLVERVLVRAQKNQRWLRTRPHRHRIEQAGTGWLTGSGCKTASVACAMTLAKVRKASSLQVNGHRTNADMEESTGTAILSSTRDDEPWFQRPASFFFIGNP